MANEKKKILSITRDDCVWTYSTHGGKGGQNATKNATAVTVKHPPSGAVGHAADSKSQWRNRQAAWKRMAETPEMKRWLKIQMGHSLIDEAEIQAEVQRLMRPENIKVEVRRKDRWDNEQG